MTRALPLLACGFLPSAVFAQDVERNLAQELTNPIASLYTLPMQLNFDQDLGVGGDGSDDYNGTYAYDEHQEQEDREDLAKAKATQNRRQDNNR
jgi:hypothetical protein